MIRPRVRSNRPWSVKRAHIANFQAAFSFLFFSRDAHRLRIVMDASIYFVFVNHRRF